MLYEKKILDYWKKNDISKKSLGQNKEKKTYTFYDGPPFATGLPHYGHLLSSVSKDVIPRYWRMRGYYSPARWGWDCHGLPIEEIVEKKLKISGKKEIEEIGIEKFNETCRESVLTFASEWKKTIERIGRFVDFDNSYKTMDADYTESVFWGLKKIYDKGLIYEDKKVLFYCPRCETPVSNFEVAMDNSYQDVTEESIFVKFLLAKTSLFLNLNFANDIYFIAWTTTPWTLPSNMALAIAKNTDYCLIEESGGYYIVADFFIKNQKNIKNPLNLKVLKRFKGKDLVGLKYIPVYTIKKDDKDFSKAYKVYSADFVTEEDGTGIVHVAPMHGEDDFALGKKENLPIFSLINERGDFNDLAPLFLKNILIQDSNRLIKRDLSDRSLLLQRKSITHSCAFCFRCSTRLFYFAIPSWFINIQKIKNRLLELNQKINWFPGHLKNGRFAKGLESAPDWNISRNRYWGAPIPLWKCQKKECSHQEFIGGKKDILKQKFSTNNYFFIRHAECIGNVKRILSSAPEKFYNPLTKKGISQAKEAGQKLKAEKIDLIISSPLTRAKETSILIAQEIGYSVDNIGYDNRLRENDMGTLDGKSMLDWHKFFDKKLNKFAPASKEYYSKKYEIKVPNGESHLDVAKRFYNFIKELEERYKDKNILIVSHGAPLKVIKNIFLGKYNISKNNEFQNAEIQKIDFKILPYNKNFEIDFHRPYIDKVKFYCPKCENMMERVKEVLDCWVESASMPFAELNYPLQNQEQLKNRFPADYITEYISQTRAWFYVMHVLNTILFDDISFKNCICTGVILAKNGEKMSKSKNNFPDPSLILEKYGADSLRLYLISSPLLKSENLSFSERELKDNYKVISTIYNILSFSSTYLPKITETYDIMKNKESLHSIDNWLLVKINQLIEKEEKGFIDYNLILGARSIKDFSVDFSWYLRVSRERLKKGDKKGIMVFKHTLLKLSKAIAPFVPFLAEEIYLQVGGEKKSVHLEKWPVKYSFFENRITTIKKTANHINDSIKSEIEEKVDYLKEIISIALNKRSEERIKIRQPLTSLTLKDSRLEKDLELLDILKKETNVKEVIFDPSLSKETTDITKVEIDTMITEELKNEGVLREITRGVQQLRKEAKLTPKDNIEVYFYADNLLKDLINDQVESLKSENNLKNIFVLPNLEIEQGLKEVKIIDSSLFVKINKI